MIARPGHLKSKNAGWRTVRRCAKVGRPFEDVTTLLATEGGQLFGTQSEEGWGLELRIRQAGAGSQRTVLVHVGGLVHLGDRMLVPVSWAGVHPASRATETTTATVKVVALFTENSLSIGMSAAE